MVISTLDVCVFDFWRLVAFEELPLVDGLAEVLYDSLCLILLLLRGLVVILAQNVQLNVYLLMHSFMFLHYYLIPFKYQYQVIISVIKDDPFPLRGAVQKKLTFFADMSAKAHRPPTPLLCLI